MDATASSPSPVINSTTAKFRVASLCGRSFLCILFFIILNSLLVPAKAHGNQSQEAKPLKLERLEFEGLKRYSRDQIAEASGLTIGQTIVETLLDDAANQLVQTGFFSNVSYRLHARGDQATVTFQVKEKVDRGLHVVFDNFVWFSDEELTSEIRREIPSYDGTTPESGNMTDKVKTVLQRFLQEKNVPGLVEYMLSSDPSGAAAANVYTIKGVSIPICEVTYQGASAIKDDELKEHSKPIYNQDFSRGIIVGFANTALGDLYRQRGFLRALFSNVSVKTRDDATCKNGVAVTLQVEEGPQYSWDKAEWIDNKAFSAEELDAALGMKQGEIASITKINKGLFQVNRALGTKGYVAATLRPTREFDDANKRVTFRIKVIEGAQYKMGTLIFTGIPNEIAAHLKSQWKLAPGAVYDASYPAEFVRLVMAKDAALSKELAGRKTKLSPEEKPDRQSLSVNVEIGVK